MFQHCGAEQSILFMMMYVSTFSKHITELWCIMQLKSCLLCCECRCYCSRPPVSSQWIKQAFQRGLDHAHINNTLVWVGSRFTHDSRFLDGRQKLTMKCCFPVPKFQACQRLRKHATIKQSLCVCLETRQRLLALLKLSDIRFCAEATLCFVWQRFLNFSVLLLHYWRALSPQVENFPKINPLYPSSWSSSMPWKLNRPTFGKCDPSTSHLSGKKWQ